MAEDVDDVAESAWREAFRQRMRLIQGKRTAENMAYLLGISRDQWNKIVNRGDAPSIRLLPKLAAIGERSLKWVVEGDQKAARKPAAEPKQKQSRRRQG